MATSTPQQPEGAAGSGSVGASGPDGPIGQFADPELDSILAERTFELETLQPDDAGTVTLRDFTIRWSDVIKERPVYSRAWPPGLYIPGDADWRKYWFTAPPRENTYQRDWSGPTTATATFAESRTGNLAAVISPARLAGKHHAWAGVAIEYSPTARLSEVRFTADLMFLAIKTYKFLTEAGLSQITFSATAFLAGWEINPVTSQWERLLPLLRHTVFNDTGYGQQSGAPLTYPGVFQNGVLGLNFLVERGKRYAFGVSFETWITLDVRERDDRTPYRQREEDTVELEARLGGSVLQMTVDTTAVYQA